MTGVTPPAVVIRGEGPVVLGMPHVGTFLDDETKTALDDNGLAIADTDWHIDRLYDGLLDGVTVVKATFHRYVIDANRDPSGVSLYPGQNTTGLCPTTDFEGRAIYRPGHEPAASEIARRLAAWHRPYHEALAAELARVKARWGVAVLYDCHSIRSRIPYLFDGRLPDFNIGTNGGTTCDTRIETAVRDIAAEAAGYTSIVNGRFRGGWTTRHYGVPTAGVHAIQMELAQEAYMIETAPWKYAESRAERLRRPLGDILRGLDELARGGSLAAQKGK